MANNRTAPTLPAAFLAATKPGTVTTAKPKPNTVPQNNAIPKLPTSFLNATKPGISVPATAKPKAVSYAQLPGKLAGVPDAAIPKPKAVATAQLAPSVKKGGSVTDTFVPSSPGLLSKIATNPILNAPGRFAENALNKLSFGLYPAPTPSKTLPGKVVDAAGKFTGEALPFALSYGTIGKAVGSIPKIAKAGKLAQLAVKGGVASGAVGAAEKAVEGGTPKEIAKNALMYGAMGAVGDPLLEGVAMPLAKKGLQKVVPKLLNRAATTEIKPAAERALQKEIPAGGAIDNAAGKTEEKFMLSADKKPGNLRNAWDKFYGNAVNTQHKLGKISPDVQVLASNSRQSQGVVDYIAEKGMVDTEGKKIGESLSELAQGLPLDKEMDFWRYMGHKHNIARAAEGKNVFSQFGPEDSAIEAGKLANANPEFEQTGKKVTEWLNKFMDTWTGDLVGKEKLDLWKSMYPDYFPIYRDMEELAKSNYNNLPKRGYVNQNNLVKKAKGAKADLSSNIKDPMLNIVQLVNKTVKAAKNNEVGLEVLKEIRKGGLDDIFQIVPTRQGLVNDINAVMKDEGIEGVMAKFADQFNDIFKQVEKGNNIVKVMENGNEVLVKVKDASYLKALQSLSEGTGQSAAEQFEKAARSVTRPLKDLITGRNPLFGIFNIMRDTPTAFIQGQENNPVKFGMRYLKALNEIAHNSKGFQEFAAQGGMQSGFFKNSLQKAVSKLKDPNASAFEKIIRKFEAFNNLTEATPRYMEYMATLEKGGTKAQAIYNAAEVTVNFAKSGKWGKFFDSFVMYLNPALQGMDKFVRQVKNKPLQTTLKATAALTVPQVITDYVNKDNPNYQSLDQRTKDDFFLIPNKWGPKDKNGYAETFFRVPKAREYSVIFAVLANRIGQVAQGKPIGEAAKGVPGSIDRTFSVPVRPLWSPFTDVGRNKDWKNAPINPLSMMMDNRSNYLKYDERTSEIGKTLAKLLNEQPIEGIKYSPKDVDYLIGSYTGIIGDLVLPIATKQGGGALGVPKRKFIADSVYSNQDVTDFYDNLGKLRTAAADKNIMQRLPSKLKTKEETRRDKMNAYADDISELNAQAKKAVSEDAKRAIREKVILIAKKGNSLYNSYTR